MRLHPCVRVENEAEAHRKSQGPEICTKKPVLQPSPEQSSLTAQAPLPSNPDIKKKSKSVSKPNSSENWPNNLSLWQASQTAQAQNKPNEQAEQDEDEHAQ